jgi:hypothetical protein
MLIVTIEFRGARLVDACSVSMLGHRAMHFSLKVPATVSKCRAHSDPHAADDRRRECIVDKNAGFQRNSKHRPDRTVLTLRALRAAVAYTRRVVHLLNRNGIE